MNSDKPLQYRYSILLSESFGEIRNLIIKCLPIYISIRFRSISKSISKLFDEYNFIFECVREYKERINCEDMDVDNEIYYYCENESFIANKKYRYVESKNLKTLSLSGHFSWLLFLYCYSNRNLSENQTDILYDSLLRDKLAKVEVSINEVGEKKKIMKYCDNSSSKSFKSFKGKKVKGFIHHHSLTMRVIIFNEMLAIAIDNGLCVHGITLLLYLIKKMSKNEKVAALYFIIEICPQPKCNEIFQLLLSDLGMNKVPSKTNRIFSSITPHEAVLVTPKKERISVTTKEGKSILRIIDGLHTEVICSVANMFKCWCDESLTDVD